MTIAPQLVDRIRQALPNDCCVLPRSLPVVSFGDAMSATVASLALNPSSREFISASGEWLLGSKRRLASLVSLGVSDPRELDDEAVATVLAESDGYFRGPNWYKNWFMPLESVLVGSGVGSLLAGTACHLDLVQWATDPVQRHVPEPAWRRLVEADQEFLFWQLSQPNLTTVLVNGMHCVDVLGAAGVVDSWSVDELPYQQASGTAALKVFRADTRGVTFLGWNRPVAGALAKDGRRALQGWLAESIPTPVAGPEVGRDLSYRGRIDVDDLIEKLLAARPAPVPPSPIEWFHLRTQIAAIVGVVDTWFRIETEVHGSDHPIYVQGWKSYDGLSLEAVSNEFLDGRTVLAPEAVSRMIEAGWSVPANEKSPNFERLYSFGELSGWPGIDGPDAMNAIADQVADDIVTAFAHAYQIPADSTWTVEPAHLVEAAGLDPILTWVPWTGPSSPGRPAEPSPTAEAFAPAANDARWVTRQVEALGHEELLRTLRHWAETSEETTIGDASTYGGRPWIRLQIGQVQAHLNADTTRSAILSLLTVAGAGSFSWYVNLNKKGVANRLDWSTEPVAGWYAYLDVAQTSAGRLYVDGSDGDVDFDERSAPSSVADIDLLDVGVLILEAVGVLHTRGRQELRIWPGMSGSGLHWRISIFDLEGARRLDRELAGDYDLPEPLFSYTTGSGPIVGNLRIDGSTTADDVADEILRTIARSGEGRDWLYAGWYVELLGIVRRDRGLPIGYADYFDPRDGWAVGSRGQRVPLPPPPGQHG